MGAWKDMVEKAKGEVYLTLYPSAKANPAAYPFVGKFTENAPREITFKDQKTGEEKTMHVINIDVYMVSGTMLEHPISYGFPLSGSRLAKAANLSKAKNGLLSVWFRCETQQYVHETYGKCQGYSFIPVAPLVKIREPVPDITEEEVFGEDV